ncbi:MAG: hypothetical protein ACN2B6_06285 [Rickettsiales bacterium]
MKIAALFKEPIHGALDEETHDSILLEATAALDGANHAGEQGQHCRYNREVINAQLDLAQSYLAYRLGFSDTADGNIPTKKDVENESERLVAQGLRVEDNSRLIKAALQTIDKKIEEALEKLPATERANATDEIMVSR